MPTNRKTTRKPRPEFFEPWTAQASKSYLPLNTSDVPVDLLSEMEGNRESLERSIPWIIWGSSMIPTGPAVKSNGHQITMDDQGIIARIERNALGQNGMPTQQQFAERICACVNACSEITDPIDMRLKLETVENELDKAIRALEKAEQRAEEAVQAFSDLLAEFHASLDYELKE